MAKLSKEEQKKQNKITIILLIIAIPIAVVIGLNLRKDKKKEEAPKEAEEVTLLKQSVSQYADMVYTYPQNNDEYVIDYESFTNYINNGNKYLKVTCTLKDSSGNSYVTSAIYTSNDKVLHYLLIRDDVLFDDHTTDKE